MQLAKNTAGDHATCGQQLKIQLVTASGQLAKNTAGDSQWTAVENTAGDSQWTAN